MRAGLRILWLLAVAAFLILTTACGNSNCSGVGLGSGGSGGGTTGGTNSGPTACSSGGGGGGGGNAVNYLYYVTGTEIVANYFDGSNLLKVPNFPTTSLGAGGAVDMLVVNNQFLYQPWAPTSTTANVQGFVVNSNGDLTVIPNSPFSMDAIADSLATDPSHKFLFMGQSGARTITVMKIDSASGALTLVSGSPFDLGGLAAAQLVVDGTGKYLYATVNNNGSGIVLGFSIDQTSGAITPLPNSPYFLGLSRMVADPTGKYLVGVGSNQLHPVAIDPTTGDLVAGLPVSPVGGASGVLLHPNGKYLYTFTQTLAPIEGFNFDPTTGSITPMSTSPFTNALPLNSAKMDPSGSVIVGLTATSAFGIVTVDQTTGVLTTPPTPTLSPGSNFFAVTD